MGVNYSAYQLAVFDFINSGTGSAIVDAKAGSGKTSTIVEACNRLVGSPSVLFMAFNKSIVQELEKKLPNGVNVLTFNACGHRAWVRYCGKKFVKVDANKTWGIIRDNFRDEDVDLYGSFCKKMVALAKANGLLPSDPDGAWFEVMDHHGLFLPIEGASYERAIELSQRVLERSIDMAKTVIDFDDQIYMPFIRNLTFDKYDLLFIDEAQDTSKVQVELLKRMLKTDGRLIAVGDPGQAIYGFRGADAESMNNIREAFDATVLPLSISYRCCKAVIELAQTIVPDIEAYEHATEGMVDELTGYAIDTFTENDAILCRLNAPLIEMCYGIIARGKPVNFLGRDIGGGLKSLIKRMEARDLEHLTEKLGNWLARESEKLEKKNQEDKIEILEDRVNCIHIFMHYLPESQQTIQGLLDAIDSLFENASGRGITLSSVHKSKGSEWNRVFILDRDLMPSKMAKKDWQRVQEQNLIYVAYTRAKEWLTFISSKCWTDEPNLTITPRPSAKKSAPARRNKRGGRQMTETEKKGFAAFLD